MRPRKDKGPLRNFRFLKAADEQLVGRSEKTGCDMTTVIEDLLLNRRQSSPVIEPKAAGTALPGLPARVAVDEAGALAMLSLDKREPDAARRAFRRFLRMHNIKTLPGDVYSVRAIERAST